MGQYDNAVERQRIILEAEEWAKGVKSVHAHPFTSLWYETRPDRSGDELRVLDVEFNDGVIEREYILTGEKEIIGEHLTGTALHDEYLRQSH